MSKAPQFSARAFLNVTNSARGKIWQGASAEISEMAERLCELSGLDPIIASIAARLGAKPEKLAEFLDPKLRDLLPDPASLRDCPEAAARINQAIIAKEKIAIFADYDVDGAASAALLVDYLRFYHIEPTIYVPDRLSEGYGPNIPAMEILAEEHALIICVDCGTLAHEPISAARAKGAEVVVIDHHMATETLPDAIIANPNRQDIENTLGHLCAAGVVFLVLVALNALRKADGNKPDLIKALDLVALATIADVAPLKGINRAFVRTGLKVMASGERIGLAALIKASLPHQRLEASHIGFNIGPRLNAGGRIGRASAASELLTAHSSERAAELVRELEAQNQERRDLEKQLTDEAIAQIEAKGALEHLAYAYGEGWHPGVLGIVATRVKSHFGKPAIIMGASAGIAQGSARSVEGIDLGGAVARLADEGLITKGGGHKMAAGLTLAEADIEAAMKRMDALLSRQSEQLVSTLNIDALISPMAASLSLLNALEKLEPFGAAAEAPRFAIADLTLQYRKVIKDQHLRLSFIASGGSKLEVMAFGAVGGKLDIAEAARQEPVHIAVSLSRNQWNGRESVTCKLEDWAWAN